MVASPDHPLGCKGQQETLGRSSSWFPIRMEEMEMQVQMRICGVPAGAQWVKSLTVAAQVALECGFDPQPGAVAIAAAVA